MDKWLSKKDREKKEFMDARREAWQLIKQVDKKMDDSISKENFSTFTSCAKALDKADSLLVLDDMEDDFVLRVHDLNNTPKENLQKIAETLKKVA